MAKVFGPGLSLAAKGKIGKSVVFQDRPKGPVMMKRPIAPRKNLDQPSPAQQVIRGYYKEAVEKWHQLTVAERKQWNDWVKSH